MQSKDASQAAETAETYYDSQAADDFYREVWGGEDIHVGIYEPVDRDIAEASHETVVRMASALKGLGADSKVLDIGAGYGGAARYLAKTYGCQVTCLNISEIQNDYNRQRTEAAGLADKIAVKHGNFEDIPEPDDTYDVVWCQDSILHSADRRKVLEEVVRVLKPGGQFVFTDPMASDDCPEGVLSPILKRLDLPSLATPGFYRKEMKALGGKEIQFDEQTQHLRNHYYRVREELHKRYDEMEKRGFKEYVDAMLQGLENWVKGADNGYLAWGIFLFEAPR